MEDEKFIEIYIKLMPRLDKYFHVCLANRKLKGSYKNIKRDLIHLACGEAYLYCHKKNAQHYEIEVLIWLKAKHTWWEFIQPPKSCGLDNLKKVSIKEHDALYLLMVKEQLDRIKEKVDDITWQIIEKRADGLGFPEIARELDDKEGRIKMLMQRLKKKLEKEALRYL
jgi:hypothetical protein